jgi:hypothetical protein
MGFEVRPGVVGGGAVGGGGGAGGFWADALGSKSPVAIASLTRITVRACIGRFLGGNAAAETVVRENVQVKTCEAR